MTESFGDISYATQLSSTIWVSQSSLNGEEPTRFILDRIKDKIILRSDQFGFSIYQKNGEIEYSVGFNNSWAKIPISYINSNVPFFFGSIYHLIYSNKQNTILNSSVPQ